MKILILKASINTEEKSISSKINNFFLENYKEKNPNDEFVEIDLNNEKITNLSLNANNFQTFWNDVDANKYIELLKNVDKIIISYSMVNFNYPAVLKNFIDAISIAGVTFSYKYSKKGDAIGLLNNIKNVQILATQGAPEGWYPWGNHVSILEGTWKFLGAQKVQSFLLAGTKVSPLSDKKIDDIVEEQKDKILEKISTF